MILASPYSHTNSRPSMRTLPYLIYGLYVSRDPIALTLTNVLSSYTNEQFISIHNLPHHSFVFITHSLTQHLLTLLRFRALCVRTYSNRTFFCEETFLKFFILSHENMVRVYDSCNVPLKWIIFENMINFIRNIQNSWNLLTHPNLEGILMQKSSKIYSIWDCNLLST